jgi:hypothetical protein
MKRKITDQIMDWLEGVLMKKNAHGERGVAHDRGENSDALDGM